MLSIPHLIVIFVVALVVFGPEKLPELARGLGKVMAEFRRHTNDLRSTFEGHLRDLEREAEGRKTGAGSLPTPVAPKPAANPILAQPAIPSPGTVPSSSPNAAAIASARPDASPSVSSSPAPGVRKHPGDDPYLADLTNGELAPLDSSSQGEAESGKVSERAPDGDVHPA